MQPNSTKVKIISFIHLYTSFCCASFCNTQDWSLGQNNSSYTMWKFQYFKIAEVFVRVIMKLKPIERQKFIFLLEL